MINMKEEQYKCNKCGELFEEPIAIPYSEYPGASVQNEYISPCCRAGYRDEW